MAFGDTIYPDNVGTPVSVDQAFPSYSAILKTGSKSAWTEVITAATVTADCHWCYVEVTKTQADATDTSAVLDIGYGLPNAITGVASTDIITSTAHGLYAGQQMSFKTITGGSGLTIVTNYFVISANLTASTFQISTTLGGSAVNFTTDITAGTACGVVIADLFAGHASDRNANSGNGGWLAYAIPVKILSGWSVAIRGQTARVADTSASIRVSLLGGASGSPYSGATCYTFGVTGTGGTVITPGSDATWSSWVNIGGTTAADIQAVSLGFQPIAGTVVNRNSYQVQIGVSSASIGPIYDCHAGTGETANGPGPTQPAYKFVASGAQLQARARGSSGGTIDNIRVALYGVSAT